MAAAKAMTNAKDVLFISISPNACCRSSLEVLDTGLDSKLEK
jgi:hypothetical protein